MRALYAATLMLAMLAGPAHAQFKSDTSGDPYQEMLARQRREQQQNEAAYDQTMKRLKAQNPATAPTTDPWGTVRPVETKPKR